MYLVSIKQNSKGSFVLFSGRNEFLVAQVLYANLKVNTSSKIVKDMLPELESGDSVYFLTKDNVKLKVTRLPRLSEQGSVLIPIDNLKI